MTAWIPDNLRRPTSSALMTQTTLFLEPTSLTYQHRCSGSSKETTSRMPNAKSCSSSSCHKMTSLKSTGYLQNAKKVSPFPLVSKAYFKHIHTYIYIGLLGISKMRDLYVLNRILGNNLYEQQKKATAEEPVPLDVYKGMVLQWPSKVFRACLYLRRIDIEKNGRPVARQDSPNTNLVCGPLATPDSFTLEDKMSFMCQTVGK
jgi:hypothetical protein